MTIRADSRNVDDAIERELATVINVLGRAVKIAE